MSVISPIPVTGSGMGSNLGLEYKAFPDHSGCSSWFNLRLLFTGGKATPQPFIKRMLWLFLATMYNYAGSLKTEPIQNREKSKILIKPRGK